MRGESLLTPSGLTSPCPRSRAFLEVIEGGGSDLRVSRLGLLIAIFCGSAGASPIAVSLLPREAVPTNSSHLKGYFQLQTSEYVSADQPYFGAGAQGESVALTLGLANDLNFATNATGRLVLSDQFSLSERWNYVNVNEAFATYQEGAAQLSVGRKLDTWIEWEETWQQGLVEPRYVQNRLRPETAGLSGLFYSARSENWGLTVGALPLNIPEFGPHFYVRDDKFVSSRERIRGVAVIHENLNHRLLIGEV